MTIVQLAQSVGTTISYTKRYRNVFLAYSEKYGNGLVKRIVGELGNDGLRNRPVSKVFSAERSEAMAYFAKRHPQRMAQYRAAISHRTGM